MSENLRVSGRQSRQVVFARRCFKLYGLYRKAIALIYPNVCPFCGRIIGAEDYWCESCREFLPYVKKTLSPPENVSRFYACCYYSQRARSAVHLMKFGGDISPADAFGLMMYEKLSDELKSADVLVPVPSGYRSAAERGFAPAVIIADRISQRSGVAVEKALKARDEKLDQKGLSAKRRAENAGSSFYVSPKSDLRGKRVILIDDVCTTGSTISAAAGLLLEAGAAEVVGAVFAKTVDFSHSYKYPFKLGKSLRKSRTHYCVKNP